MKFLMTLLMAVATSHALAIDLADAVRVEPYSPVEVDGENATITTATGERLPDGQVIRLAGKTIWSAAPGRYVVVSEDRIGLVIIGDDQPPQPTPDPIPNAAEVVSVDVEIEPEEKPEVPETMLGKVKVLNSIILLTRPNCPPCDRWKAEEKADLQATGTTVTVESLPDSLDHFKTPSFAFQRIEADGAKFWSVTEGYFTAKQLEKMLADYKKQYE